MKSRMLGVVGFVFAGSAAFGQSVEILDWVGVVGISRDSTQQYEVVRSASLPYEGNPYSSYFTTSTTPSGFVNPYFDVQQSEGRFAYDIYWLGEVSSASGDGSTDGPFAELAVLVRTTVPLTHDIEAFVYIGGGAGNASTVPWSRLSIVEGFCFTPGQSPAAGQEWCTGHPGAGVVNIDHADGDGYESSLFDCCPVVSDVGSQYGVLEPGDYTIYLRTGTDINHLFSGASVTDMTGSNSMILTWTEQACLPDLNGDGFVDVGDITMFVNLFLAQDFTADLNGDGFLDIGDITTFVDAFLVGC